MKEKELQQIVLGSEIENVADILSSSEESHDIYVPEVGCTGVGGAACKDGCIGGCKDVTKTGGVCSTDCQPGCKESCLKGCKIGKK
ncbi:MAG: hypothetical protein K2J00_05335 [Bacteroidaceae bacterium]|nr:hypothetical protein [Bacteroidaceae bacterium]